MTQRTDIHRPSLLDPSEYEFCAAFYQGASVAMERAYRSDHEEYATWIEDLNPVRPGTQRFTGNYSAKQTCDHCGAAFNHGVLFHHKPTGDLIHVGHICASDTIGLPSKAAAARKRAEKAAREEAARVRRHEENAAWREENEDVVSFLNEYVAKVGSGEWPQHDFLDDMVTSFTTWGNLWPNQANAVRKFFGYGERQAERAAREAAEAEALADAPPLAEGRRSVVGEIVSTKYKETPYGTTLKMLVKDIDGNKVWGTVPRVLEDKTFGENGIELKGQTVTFTATVERSRDDEHFGFFKKPTKAQIVGEEVLA